MVIKLSQEIADQIRAEVEKKTIDLANKYGVSQRTIQDIRANKSYKNQVLGMIDGTVLAAVPEGFIVKRVSTQMEADGTTKSQWLGSKEEHALGDIREAVPEGHRIIGMSTLVSGDGTTTAQWVKTKIGTPDPQKLLEEIMAEMPKKVIARKGSIKKSKKICDSKLLACYVLGDPHLGLTAWAPECGANFDLKIAEKLMTTAIRDLVLRGPKAKKALLVSLGDMLHADNIDQHTTHGNHSLDVDGRMSKIAVTAMSILTQMIDSLLEHHDEVEVDIIGGNHSEHSEMLIAIALQSYYRNEPRITIPVHHASRHYHQFNKVLIGSVHGDKTKLESLGEIMAAEQPKAWGETTHRTFLMGHVHHSQVKELRGCTVETFRTLAARDSWHSGKGYSAGRDLRRIVYHETYGEISREVAGLAYLEDMIDSKEQGK